MKQITKLELDSAMVKNGKIENVCVFIPDNYSTSRYYRMCVFHQGNEREDSRVIEFWANQDNIIWLFLANPHPKAKECGSRELWLCDIVYSGDGWEDEQGKYYPVNVFKVHPKQLLEKWS